MEATFNWTSIEKKIGKSLKKKSLSAALPTVDTLAKKFQEIMHGAIAKSAGLTQNEFAVVANVPFVLAHASTTSIPGSKMLIDAELGFDFDGDKSLVSISPNKKIDNLVALFNNGYPSGNNVNPKKPPMGMWHGIWLVIQPRTRMGAAFVQKAAKEFQEWAESQGMTVTYEISYEYDVEAS